MSVSIIRSNRVSFAWLHRGSNTGLNIPKADALLLMETTHSGTSITQMVHRMLRCSRNKIGKIYVPILQHPIVVHHIRKIILTSMLDEHAVPLLALSGEDLKTFQKAYNDVFERAGNSIEYVCRLNARMCQKMESLTFFFFFFARESAARMRSHNGLMWPSSTIFLPKLIAKRLSKRSFCSTHSLTLQW